MALSSITGYPRIGTRRELKRAVEGFWDGKTDRDGLEETARALRLEAWTRMRDAGIDLIPSNTFSYYDHVLDTIAMVDAVPPRYRPANGHAPAANGHAPAANATPPNGHDEHAAEGGADALETYFAMARGAQRDGLDVTALEMTKWFDTNYHYLVPELAPSTRFRLATRKPLDEYLEARAAGIETVPVLVGPISFLLLAKGFDDAGDHDDDFDRLSLLPALLDVYAEVVGLLSEAGAQWIQFDEPTLVQDRTPEELQALTSAYTRMAAAAGTTKLLVQTYFGDVDEAYRPLSELPVAAIGLDLVRGQRNLDLLRRDGLPGGKHVVAGVVDGRNVWANDLEASLALLREVGAAVGEDRLIAGTSCSLLHSPLELEQENALDAELRSWLAFANQKIAEVATLARALEDPNDVADELAANRTPRSSRAATRRAPATPRCASAWPPRRAPTTTATAASRRDARRSARASASRPGRPRRSAHSRRRPRFAASAAAS